ncbi:MAG: hypothetical protein ACTSUE_25195 [Promethearchaeota archaeon]
MSTKLNQMLKDGRILFICSVLINFFVYFLNGVRETQGWVDFYSVFMNTAEAFLDSPGNIYFGENISVDYTYYRNLPAHVLYLLPFYFMGNQNHVNLFSQSLVIFYSNLGSCLFIHKIFKLERVKETRVGNFLKSPFFVMSAYLLVMMHFLEYLSGHTHAQAGFFSIVGIYYLLKGDEHLAFMSWSVASIFKLNPLIWSFFFIVKPPFKKFLKNLVFAAAPQVLNITMFLLWPKLINDFLESNIYFSREIAPHVYLISGTISRELSYLFGTDILPFSIATLAACTPITIIYMYFKKIDVFDKILLVSLTTIAIVPDFTTAHIFYFIVPFFLWSTKKRRRGAWYDYLSIALLSVPTLLLTPWFYFPCISPFYFIPLIILYVTRFRKKPVNQELPRREGKELQKLKIKN